MTDAQGILLMAEQQDEFVRNAVTEHGSRLFGFIRNRVDDVTDAEDILQDVYYELTETTRMDEPVQQVAAWLFRVARNKIIDRYRKKSTARLDDAAFSADGEDEPLFLSELLASDTPGPEQRLDNSVLMMAVEKALDGLPPEQRDVFMRHELGGESFKEISATTGVSVNTLLSRKRYAVLQLRERLQHLYEELFQN